MVALSLAFTSYLIFSLWYIRKLHKQLQSYEHDWQQIERLTDHNKEGDVVIHCKHI